MVKTSTTCCPGIERVVPPGIKELTYQRRDNEEGCLVNLTRDLAERIFNRSLDTPSTMGRAVLNQCAAIINDQRLLAKMTDVGFDIAVIDGFPLMPCGFVIPHNLSVPFVSSSAGSFGWETRVLNIPSFVPSPFMPFTRRMSFWQRALNVLLHAILALESLPPCWDNALLHEFAPDVTSWAALRRKAAFFIVSHVRVAAAVATQHGVHPGDNCPRGAPPAGRIVTTRKV